MEDIIDMHSHILPQLDDGSTDIMQTINMLKTAYSEGIRTIIATPHYNEKYLFINDNNRILFAQMTVM